MSSNNELDKFKGDGTQDVNAWFTNYEQWTHVHDLHYVKTTPLLAVKEHPLTCSLYILNVLAKHQLQTFISITKSTCFLINFGSQVYTLSM